MKKIFARLILTTLTIASLTMNVNAQDAAFKVNISPTSIEKTIRPGETITTEIQVTNASAIAHTLEGDVQDFYINEGGAVTIVTSEELKKDPELEKYSLKSWITHSGLETSFTKNEQRKIQLQITAPKDATPGGHYGIIFFTEKSTGSQTKGAGGEAVESAIGAQGSVGTMLVINVPGSEIKQGGVEKFTAGIRNPDRTFTPKFIFGSQSVFEKTQMAFSFFYQNGSATHVKPVGFIKITDIFGDKIEEIPVESTRVFPGTGRNIITSYEHGFLPGIYRAFLTVTDASKANFNSSTTFVIFPWKFALTILITLIALIAAGYWYRRHLVKKYGIRL